MNYPFGDPTSVSFDADYQAILDRATALGYTKPSANQQILQNALVTSMKSAGTWAELDIFYMFANDGSQEFATLNWINPSAHQCTLTNAPTFTSNQGFFGTGSSYISTNYTPSTQAVNASLNLASRLMWVYSSLGSTGDFFAGTNPRRGSWRGGNPATEVRINASGNLATGINLSGTGLHLNSRPNSTTSEYKSINANDSQTLNSDATTYSYQIRLLTLDTTSIYASSSTGLSCFGYGGYVHSTYTDLNSALTTYMGAI